MILGSEFSLKSVYQVPGSTWWVVMQCYNCVDFKERAFCLPGLMQPLLRNHCVLLICRYVKLVNSGMERAELIIKVGPLIELSLPWLPPLVHVAEAIIPCF